jgi:hypothetical protein
MIIVKNKKSLRIEITDQGYMFQIHSKKSFESIEITLTKEQVLLLIQTLKSSL